MWLCNLCWYWGPCNVKGQTQEYYYKNEVIKVFYLLCFDLEYLYVVVTGEN